MSDSVWQRLKDEWNSTYPALQLLGVRVDRIEEGFACLTLPFKEELTNPNGTVQGGIISTLADAAASLAFLSLLGEGTQVATIEFKINFLSPVWEGEMMAEAKVLRKGRTLGVMVVEVKGADAKVMAKVLATNIILP
ncbi:MAG: PaaI family thioesterase, partial [candidate division NC10 bacterium]|nr:PaaI family thioesterase [candidate division NC10 bacterium]